MWSPSFYLVIFVVVAMQSSDQEELKKLMKESVQALDKVYYL